jgi:predicted phosphodiesterase
VLPLHHSAVKTPNGRSAQFIVVTVLIAALYDVHGNLAGLDAVLREARDADVIVVGGDVASGPQPVEVLDRLSGLGERVRWVMGNADRAVLDPADSDDEAGRADRFTAALLQPHHRELIASFEPTVELDGVVFCHGTPRSDEEIVTRLTPQERLDALAGTARLVVAGHTHQQFHRRRWVNAGSVGRPCEGRPGAYWALVDGEPQLRRTDYELDPDAIRATGYPDAEDWLAESFLDPVDPDFVARHFEDRWESSQRSSN